MGEQFDRFNSRHSSLIAGICLLLIVITAGYSYGFVFNTLFDESNSVALFDQLYHSQTLFRSGIYGFLIILILEIVLSWALYEFFKAFNKQFSLLFVLFRLLYTAVLFSAILKLIEIAVKLNSSIQSVHISLEISDLFIIFNEIWAVGLAVFGLHLILMGYLFLIEKNLPLLLGIFLIIAGLLYFLTNSANVIMYNYLDYKGIIEMIFALPMTFGELLLAFWLLIKGGKLNQN
jgi:hypothetical protein